MIFWILIAGLTAVAALSVLVPLSRTRRLPETVASQADEAVYREQLNAIETELERGLIDADTAEAARTEIARRLLAAHERVKAAPGASRPKTGLKLAQAVAVLALPAVTFGLYLLLGTPDLPDQPLHARLTAPAEGQSVDVLVARVERHLADNPEDGQGWAVVAPVYLSLGQPRASAKAYANAIRILGPKQEWLTDMGEALAIAEQGLVTAEAQRAFEQAVALEPSAVKPRFFLAIALGQEGRKVDAIAAWEALLDGADPTAAWVGAARQELARLTGETPNMTAPRGPSQEDIAAAADMSRDDQQAMIRGMVSGLAERLTTEGGSVEEWNRLIRAYMVLGDKAEAEKALASAQAAFAENQNDLSRIKDAARQLGLSGS
ncbi:c-type cytochrome biogenesis protein CcmI [Roseibium sediminicola]|uniref:C-type cytochrome biogenesis protein CcmI n=1 Tax=Roseibium sediminicola TaxID=2933272 RepID=A0ABT0GS18_9HYPH|nr:c-type cytochrome biogenesis protein CcmI [Roseibium sp. CAU 1639]MCK7611635.1 c-type cytochrome biogenesis protein CcmI [Roseibium sp. CAU 1639]